MKNLLRKYELYNYDGVFYKGGELPIVCVEIEHSISNKVILKPRRLSRELVDEVSKYMEELSDAGSHQIIK